MGLVVIGRLIPTTHMGNFMQLSKQINLYQLPSSVCLTLILKLLLVFNTKKPITTQHSWSKGIMGRECYPQ